MSRRVLTIDDDPAILTLVKYNLERERIEVITAISGAEGLRCARELKPDLILLDVMMPTMTGPDVLAHLKADPTTRDIPVVMLTAVDLPEVIAASYEQGAEWHLLKPFDLALLKEVVAQLLERNSEQT